MTMLKRALPDDRRVKHSRTLYRLTPQGVAEFAQALRSGESTVAILDVVDYDSLVRIRIAVQGKARMDHLHAKALAEEAA